MIEHEEYIKVYGASDDLIEVRASDGRFSEVCSAGGEKTIKIKDSEDKSGIVIKCHYQESIAPGNWSLEIGPLNEMKEVDWDIGIDFDGYQTIATIGVNPSEVVLEGDGLNKKDWNG